MVTLRTCPGISRVSFAAWRRGGILRIQALSWLSPLRAMSGPGRFARPSRALGPLRAGHDGAALPALVDFRAAGGPCPAGLQTGGLARSIPDTKDPYMESTR